MRRTLLTLAALLVLVLVPSASAAGPHLSRGGDAEFPHRSFLLSLPTGASAAAPGAVSVLENGKAVRALAVKPTRSASAGELGTVLVIDASASMKGAPIRRAMAAARAFATHRHESQKLGVVTFNRFARVALEPTTDSERIDEVLATRPRLAGQTRVRDATITGLEALERAKVKVGSVVVLSDGADTGSRASAEDVAEAAAAQAARVFAVGLRSEHFDEATLAQLAEASDGEYLAAGSTADLRPIFDNLGAQLKREYLVRYSSVEGPGSRVHVEATVRGVPGEATLTYTSPKLGAKPLPPADPKADGFWASGLVMILVGFAVAFLLCFAVAWVLMEKHRPATPQERVRAFVAMGNADNATEEEEPSNGLYDRLERLLSQNSRWKAFSLDVTIGRIARKPIQIAVVTACVTVFIAWLFAVVSGTAWVPLFAIAVPISVRKFVAHRAEKQRALFGEQLADNLQVIASAMRAGQSFGGALAVAVEDAPEPAREEFRRVVSDEQLGVPLEKSLATVVERMNNRDLHQVSLVAALQREAGGNSAEVLDRVADTIRERVALRRLISTLTAQGRMSRWVVSLVPVGLVLFIGLTKPGYLDPLFKTTPGNVLLVLAIVMMVAGSLVIKKIVQIKV